MPFSDWASFYFQKAFLCSNLSSPYYLYFINRKTRKTGMPSQSYPADELAGCKV